MTHLMLNDHDIYIKSISGQCNDDYKNVHAEVIFDMALFSIEYLNSYIKNISDYICVRYLKPCAISDQKCRSINTEDSVVNETVNEYNNFLRDLCFMLFGFKHFRCKEKFVLKEIEDKNSLLVFNIDDESVKDTDNKIIKFLSKKYDWELCDDHEKDPITKVYDPFI